MAKNVLAENRQVEITVLVNELNDVEDYSKRVQLPPEGIPVPDAPISCAFVKNINDYPPSTYWDEHANHLITDANGKAIWNATCQNDFIYICVPDVQFTENGCFELFVGNGDFDIRQTQEITIRGNPSFDMCKDEQLAASMKEKIEQARKELDINVEVNSNLEVDDDTTRQNKAPVPTTKDDAVTRGPNKKLIPIIIGIITFSGIIWFRKKK